MSSPLTLASNSVMRCTVNQDIDIAHAIVAQCAKYFHYWTSMSIAIASRSLSTAAASPSFCRSLSNAALGPIVMTVWNQLHWLLHVLHPQQDVWHMLRSDYQLTITSLLK